MPIKVTVYGLSKYMILPRAPPRYGQVPQILLQFAATHIQLNQFCDITSEGLTRIASFVLVDRLGGGRAATLTSGLKAISSELFAVLDDDDFWLAGHIAALLRQNEQSAPGRAYAYSGYLTVEEPAVGEAATARERRHIASMVPAYGTIGAGGQAGATFVPHCWLASSALLRIIDLEDWTLSTAEDSVLPASLMGRAEPLFSYRAPACTVRGLDGQSDWSNVPTRDEDVVEYFLRVYSVIDQIENKLRAPSDSNWGMVNWALQKSLETKSKRLTVHPERLVLGSKAGASIHEWDDLVINQISLTPKRVQLAGETSFVIENGEAYWQFYRKGPLGCTAQAFGSIRRTCFPVGNGSSWNSERSPRRRGDRSRTNKQARYRLPGGKANPRFSATGRGLAAD